MRGGRFRAGLRRYSLELIIALNLVAVHGFMNARGFQMPALDIAKSVARQVPSVVTPLVIFLALRLMWAWKSGKTAQFLEVLRRRRWWLITGRLVLAGAVTIHEYAWLKLLVPLLNPRSYDLELWNLDQTLAFGFSPNALLLNLLSSPLVLRAIDWSYANIFLMSVTVSLGFFLSDGSDRRRLAYASGNTILWISAAWLYVAVPSVGPCYRFPDVWSELVSLLPRTQFLQKLLIQNYQLAMQLRSGVVDPQLQIFLGVAAFPSMHVAFQTYTALALRRVWTPLGALFTPFALIIFIGSVVTGWHYLVDSYAGVIMAFAAFAIGTRLYGWRPRQHSRETAEGARG